MVTAGTRKGSHGALTAGMWGSQEGSSVEVLLKLPLTLNGLSEYKLSHPNLNSEIQSGLISETF